MDLNDIMRNQGEPTYHTPVAVIGTMIENTNGGQVTIINPPFEVKKPTKRKKWIKKWHAFGLFFAVSNGRLKKRDERQYKGGWKQYVDDRKEVFELQHHRCPECGQEFETFKDLEAHHALPWCRFPELRNKKENLVLLCHKCHKEIHCNPYKNIRMQETWAKRLGIDLKQRYDYGKADQDNGCEDYTPTAD